MTTSNFSEVAARAAAATNDVRVCLIVSQDGLTLGVFPEDGEDAARAAWGRMVASGDPEPERGFLTVGEETWAFTRRGGYGALATADRSVRPGLMLDALDSVLRELHQERVEAAPAPAAPRRASEPATPATRARTSIHAEPKAAERRAAAAAPRSPVRQLDPQEMDTETDVTVQVVDAPGEPEPAPAPRREPARLEPAIPRVDTVELTREFGGLFDGPGSR